MSIEIYKKNVIKHQMGVGKICFFFFLVSEYSDQKAKNPYIINI